MNLFSLIKKRYSIFTEFLDLDNVVIQNAKLKSKKGKECDMPERVTG